MRLFYLALTFIVTLTSVYGQVDSEDSDEKADASDDMEKVYNTTYHETMDKLHTELFKGYNRKQRPMGNTQTVNVLLHAHVAHISFNQKEQTMTLHGHLYMAWMDNRLVWDKNAYGGVSTVNVKKWQVWLPDIRVANSINGLYSAYDISRNAHVSLTSLNEKQTKVETYPTFAIKVGCLMDFSDYPYDENYCSARLYSPRKMHEVRLNVLKENPPTLSLSWTTNSTSIRKNMVSDFRIFDMTHNISYFRMGDTDQTAPITANELMKTWSIMNLYVHFRRESNIYAVGAIIPLFVTTTMTHCSLLHPDPSFGAMMNVITLLMHVLYIHEFILIMPISIYAVPKAVVYYGMSLVMAALVFLINVLFMAMAAHPKGQQIMIDWYAKAREKLPFQPYPEWCKPWANHLGEIRTRGWANNVKVWRYQAWFIVSVIFTLTFTKAFIIPALLAP